MAKAWNNYFSKRKPEREDFAQKLRHFVDVDETEEGAIHACGNVCADFDEVVPQSSVDDGAIIPPMPEVCVAIGTSEVGESITIDADAHDDAVHELVLTQESVEPIMDDGVEIARWACANHHNIERDVAIYPPDTAVLSKMPDDSMVLAYNIGGEGRSHCVVDSLAHAEEMIIDDNESTQELYPDLPEALWCHV